MESLNSAGLPLWENGSLASLNLKPKAWCERCWASACVVLQEFAGEDTTDLFLEERETALRQAQEEKHKLQMSVPGILNPHEIPEEMCDWAPAQPNCTVLQTNKQTNPNHSNHNKTQERHFSVVGGRSPSAERAVPLDVCWPK